MKEAMKEVGKTLGSTVVVIVAIVVLLIVVKAMSLIPLRTLVNMAIDGWPMLVTGIVLSHLGMFLMQVRRKKKDDEEYDI